MEPTTARPHYRTADPSFKTAGFEFPTPQTTCLTPMKVASSTVVSAVNPYYSYN